MNAPGVAPRCVQSRVIALSFVRMVPCPVCRFRRSVRGRKRRCGADGCRAALTLVTSIALHRPITAGHGP
jgi:hypothetical protein